MGAEPSRPPNSTVSPTVQPGAGMMRTAVVLELTMPMAASSAMMADRAAAEVSPEEYAVLREGLLAGRAHTVYNSGQLAFQRGPGLMGLHQRVHLPRIVGDGSAGDDAEAAHLIVGHGHDRDHARAAMGVGDRLHGRQHPVAGHEHVAEQHVEGLAGRLLGRAAHRVPQPQGLFLVHVAHRVAAHGLHSVGVGVLAALAQKRHQLGVRREMILDGLLLAAVDNDHLVGRRCQALLHDILNGRPIHHQQHLLRLGLGGRQKAGAKPRRGNESLHVSAFLFVVRVRP